MERQTVDQLINEYGQRLADLEGMYYQMNGYYPYFDCHEFWDDRAVRSTDALLEFWWSVKKAKEGRHAS